MARICTKCKETKEDKDFYKGKSECKTCHNARMLDYKRQHPEASQRDYEKNKLSYKTKAKRWADANPEKRRAVLKNYRENHPDVTHYHHVKRRASENNAEGMFSWEEWIMLLQKYGNKCLACGSEEVTRDHVVPISRGGSNTIDNIQPLCKPCNSRKGTQTIDYRTESA